jgi:hypothetical protein
MPKIVYTAVICARNLSNKSTALQGTNLCIMLAHKHRLVFMKNEIVTGHFGALLFLGM